jgi:hypothetical protein
MMAGSPDSQRRETAYEGNCAGCGERLRILLSSEEASLLLPPPFVLAIHQCATPPVETNLVYMGRPRG